MTLATERNTSKVRRFPVEDTGPSDWHFDDTKALCDFCAKEIRASKIKYSKLAEKAGVCHSTISKMARGETNFPRANTILEILRALGFNVVVRG
jgi:DNA-binding phage protein